MKSVYCYDSKSKFVKALLFQSFHETEAPNAFYRITRVIIAVWSLKRVMKKFRLHSFVLQFSLI